MGGNLPNAEEAQDVVDAVGGKVFCHFAETLLPPLVIILFHYIPIVCGDPPVLSVSGECIGRCTGLSVHIEIIRLNPGFHTIAADSDGDISFKDNALFACIIAGIQ